MHDHIHKIVSDTLTQFACIFAAIIQDCDHYGVPNAQLVKERLPISQLYGNRSVAEQNSIDIAFKILMEDCYGKLRSAIYSTTFEFVRFRQLVVNGTSFEKP
jgi:3'5'-cyclic nucleotide phosphodiesterase